MMVVAVVVVANATTYWSSGDSEHVFCRFVHAQHRRGFCEQTVHGVGVDTVKTIHQLTSAVHEHALLQCKVMSSQKH